jgi:hypothetical protein
MCYSKDHDNFLIVRSESRVAQLFDEMEVHFREKRIPKRFGAKSREKNPRDLPSLLVLGSLVFGL